MDQKIRNLLGTTDRSRGILLAAKAAADRYGSADITPEQLIHSLYYERKGIAAHVLQWMGWTPSQCESHYAGTASRTVLDLKSSAFLAGIMTEASTEAAALNHTHVGTEHLLMAMTKLCPETMSDAEAVRREVLTVLGHRPA